MGVPVLLMLASMVVPVAHASWALEVDTITAEAQHAPLTRSDVLDRAAERAAKLGPRPDLRRQLRAQGLRDGVIVPVVVISPGLPEIREAWRRYVIDHVLPQGVTHYGLAVHEDTMAVVFSRRLFTLEALPERPRSGQNMTLKGVLHAGLSQVSALVGRPDELVSPAAVRQRGQRVWIEVPLRAGPGTYLVEVIAQGTRGPEVVAMVPIHSEGAERGPNTPCIETERAAGVAPEEHVITLVNRDRQRLGLPTLRSSETLSASASRHAGQMAQRGIAAHVLPGGASPVARARAFDVETERFHENVAMASSLGQAHADLWASPSHRRALLDPSVNRIGVGVHTIQTDGGPIHFVVQHLAHL